MFYVALVHVLVFVVVVVFLLSFVCLLLREIGEKEELCGAELAGRERLVAVSSF